jgi:hypothetical protein
MPGKPGKPGKRVTFNPVVEVREMNVSYAEHAQEVKNPKEFIQVVPAPAPVDPGVTPAPAPAWLIMFLIIICIIIAVYVYRTNRKTETVLGTQQHI